MKMFLKTPLAIFIALTPTLCGATVESYLLSRKGLAQLEKKEFQGSLGSWIRALESDPMNPKLHLNLGLSLMQLGEAEKAAKVFSTVEKLSRDPVEKFVSSFNEGVAYGEAKQVELALKAYQKALAYQPESKEVKTNIELLVAQQGGGGGGGKSDPNNKGDQKSDEPSEGGKGEGKDKKQPPPKPKPQKFKSEELTASDVKKILDELKSQEQGIRAKEYQKGQKERADGKDW